MEYEYNDYRQLRLQKATSIPTGVDDHVKSIQFLDHPVYHTPEYVKSYA